MPNNNNNNNHQNNTNEAYEKIGKIGEGTYSNVFSARAKQTGRLVALKEIFLNSDEGAPCTALREIAFLKQLNSHPNILRLLEVLHPREDSLTLVFEHLSLDLKQFIERHYPDGIPMDLVRILARQILQGLHTCHANHILHRDLKPQNILLELKPPGDNEDDLGLEKDVVAKIGDFGLARGFAIPVSGYCAEVVTLWYRPPEILLGSTTYGSAVDLWSLGCILVEMLTGQALFRGKNAEDQLRKIIRVLGSPPPEDLGTMVKNEQMMEMLRSPPVAGMGVESVFTSGHVDPQVIQLISQLLCWRPQDRLSAAQALSSPFFSSKN